MGRREREWQKQNLPYWSHRNTNEKDRKKLLESIRFVDKVFIFNTKEEMEQILIDQKIDLIVVGNEYKNGIVTGSDICKVSFFEKIPGISTTKILERGSLKF